MSHEGKMGEKREELRERRGHHACKGRGSRACPRLPDSAGLAGAKGQLKEIESVCSCKESGARLGSQARRVRRRSLQPGKSVLVLGSQKLTGVATGGDVTISRRSSCLSYGEELGRR